LAAALERVRPQAESPIALIEVMKAAARLVGWAEAVKMSAMASFERQRLAEAADIPRPSGLAVRGRPTDPERSRAAEVACALRLAPGTVRRHIDTALRLIGVLSATRTGLRCGALTLSKAIAICAATRELDPVQARAVEAHVLKRAAGQTWCLSQRRRPPRCWCQCRCWSARLPRQCLRRHRQRRWFPDLGPVCLVWRGRPSPGSRSTSAGRIRHHDRADRTPLHHRTTRPRTHHPHTTRRTRTRRTTTVLLAHGPARLM
jgi:hypothetical protein